jgi:hypothetical protein
MNKAIEDIKARVSAFLEKDSLLNIDPGEQERYKVLPVRNIHLIACLTVPHN